MLKRFPKVSKRKKKFKKGYSKVHDFRRGFNKCLEEAKLEK
jgi:hypothetical protein